MNTNYVYAPTEATSSDTSDKTTFIHVIYFLAWGAVLFTGAIVNYWSTLIGIKHEYLVGLYLNIGLFVPVLFLFFLRELFEQRGTRMLMWLLHYFFLAPIIVVFGYMVDRFGYGTPEVFYYAAFFVCIPALYFLGITGVNFGVFLSD